MYTSQRVSIFLLLLASDFSVLAHAGTKGGYFEVNNNSGGSITVMVDDQKIRIAPTSSTTIELPRGTYKAQISTMCGSVTEKLNIRNGSRKVATYSCVQY